MKLARLCAAFAAILATSTATATIHNLESYHFRHDFSTGERVFIGSAHCSTDFFYSSTAAKESAVEGPNGANSAVHVGSDNYGILNYDGSQVNPAFLSTNDWTMAVCFRSCAVEKGVLFAVGRQNTTNGRSAVALCSSSDPTQLYVYDTRKSGSAATVTQYKTITGLSNMTNGFHTAVLSYACASSNVTVYVDGVSRTTIQIGNGNKSYYLGETIQYCTTPSWRASVLSATCDADLAFYDVRFYLGAFNDNDAESYATMYPCTYPFRVNAYVEASASSTTANPTVGSYIDTGYLAKGETTRFAVDYQFLDKRAQQRIFGARGNFIQGLYVRGSSATENLAWNFMGTATWQSTGNNCGRARRIATFDRVGKTVAITNHADRTQFYANSTLAALLADTPDATQNTFLFAESTTSGTAANFGKARIYSFEVDESGTPVHFYAPATNDVGEAGLYDVIDGTFKGDANKDDSGLERPLRFYNGVGCADDYKYEDSTLYAKLYATSESFGTVSVAGGTSATSAEGWIPHGGTLALSASVVDSDMEFYVWTGDTWAIADGYSATDSSIELSTPYAVQLRATYKPAANALLTVAADGDDSISWTAADWRDVENAETAISVPVDKEVTIVAHKSFTLTVDETVALDKLTVTGDVNCVVTLAKASSGSLVADEVVVSGGVLKQGMASILGATPLVTVEDGGTFDLNQQNVNDATSFTIAGAGAGDWPWALTSSGGSPDGYVHNIALAADATIGCADTESQLKVGYASGTSRGALTLDGHTLTISGSMRLTIRRLQMPETGTILYNGRGFAVYEYGLNTEDGETTLILGDGIYQAPTLNAVSSIHALEWRGCTLNTSSYALTVKSSLTGYGTTAQLTFADGATAVLEGDLAVSGTLTAEGSLSLSRAAGVETNVTFAATGTLAATGTVSVGAGVVFDIGVIRPEATFAIDNDATLALQRTSTEEETITLNVSAQPQNIVLRDTTGTVLEPDVAYDAENGTLTLYATTPVWSNADGTGAFSAAANWSSGAMPSSGRSFKMSLSGDTTVTVDSAYAFGDVQIEGTGDLAFAGAGSLSLGTVYLADDMAFAGGEIVSVAGMDVPEGSSASLATIDSAADGGITGAGSLSLAPGATNAVALCGLSAFTGELDLTATCSMTGTLTCAATSLAKFTFNGTTNVVFTLVNGTGGSLLAGEVVVAGGVLQQGSASAIGKTPKLTVVDGATFDLNGLAPTRSTVFYLAGAGAGDWPWALTSSAAGSVSKTADFINLTADATIGGEVAFYIGIRDAATFATSAATWPLTLNGHTLTKTGSCDLYYRRPYSTNEGTIDVQSGALRIIGWTYANAEYGQTSISNVNLVVREGTTVENRLSYTLHFKTIDLRSATMASSSGAFAAKEAITGHGEIAKLEMADGSVFKPDGTGYLNVTAALTGTVAVDVGGLSDAASIPLLTVPSTLADTARSAFDLSAVPAGLDLKEKTDDSGSVSFYLRKRGFMLIVR